MKKTGSSALIVLFVVACFYVTIKYDLWREVLIVLLALGTILLCIIIPIIKIVMKKMIGEKSKQQQY